VISQRTATSTDPSREKSADSGHSRPAVVTSGTPTSSRWFVRILSVVLKVAIVFYAIGILGFIWFTKNLTFASLSRDPLFAAYSIAVVLYVLGRFLLAMFYKPVPDRGHRPTVSIIIPAFNEEEGIAGTIASCLQVDYPPELVEVIAVNDGSTDGTWRNMAAAHAASSRLVAIDLGRNYGKRGAMAEGIRRATGEILCFVDSDSYLKPDALTAIVQPFTDERVGAVVGHAEVHNRMTNWITKMQQVRYYSAFRVIKATESVLSGTVTCASGCCAAYRKAVVMPLLPGWEFQTFLGRAATFGDDRSITNRILANHRIVYQATAEVETVAPVTLRVFLRQQLRWKKSWLRESLYVLRYFWRKNPLAALFTYASIGFPFMAPFVVLHAVGGRMVAGSFSGLWFYLIGTYAMAVLYSLFYAFRRPDGMWYHGMTFVALYMGVLVFQTYWGIFTMRDTRWGTRESTVEHADIDQDLVTQLRSGIDQDLVTQVRTEAGLNLIAVPA
jgi:hyaluronan synthase